MLAVLVSLLKRAESSRLALFLLNFVLYRTIPFNHPHRIHITELTPLSLKVKLPYRRSNMNHLKGLHACGLATAAEFATGVLLLKLLNSPDYRLIMKSFKVEYYYQGKLDAEVNFALPKGGVEAEQLAALERGEAVVATFKTEVRDRAGNHLCSAWVEWQIKPWSATGNQVPNGA